MLGLRCFRGLVFRGLWIRGLGFIIGVYMVYMDLGFRV